VASDSIRSPRRAARGGSWTQLGPERWGALGAVGEEPLGEMLGESIGRMLDVGDLRAGRLAEALGGPEDALHLLRLTLSAPEGELVGGYSIVVNASYEP